MPVMGPPKESRGFPGGVDLGIFRAAKSSGASFRCVMYPTESRLQPDVKRARREFLRAYILRIARSSSSTSAFSRRVTPTEPDISRFWDTTCRKVDP